MFPLHLQSDQTGFPLICDDGAQLLCVLNLGGCPEQSQIKSLSLINSSGGSQTHQLLQIAQQLMCSVNTSVRRGSGVTDRCGVRLRVCVCY